MSEVLGLFSMRINRIMAELTVRMMNTIIIKVEMTQPVLIFESLLKALACRSI